MSLRLGILLSVLAVVVVATVIAGAYMDSRDSCRQVAFSLCGYTNSPFRAAILRITNQEPCAVAVTVCCMRSEGARRMYPFSQSWSGEQLCLKLPRGCSGTITVNLPYWPGEQADPATRGFRLYCREEHLTLFDQARRRVASWPIVGRLVQTRPQYFWTQLFRK